MKLGGSKYNVTEGSDVRAWLLYMEPEIPKVYNLVIF